MHWATRKGIQVDRIGCSWLIRRYIDPEGEIAFVDPSEIGPLTEQGVLTFDAEDSLYRHDLDPVRGDKYGERCTFEVMIEKYGLREQDIALDRLARIVWAADIGHRIGVLDPAEGFGLWAVARGFVLTVPEDDRRLELGFALFDGLLAYCASTT